ncbi:MAG: cupin domain-containing protein [Acidimicrobiales bacterium]
MADVSDSYFASVEGTPTADGRFVTVDTDTERVEFIKGLTFNPVVGEAVMASFVRYEPRTEAPVHAHAEEQFTIVVEGELEFDLDGETRVLGPGQVAVIPPYVPHGARTRDQPCLEIDVFSPPRQALLALLDAERADEPPA